MRRRVHVHIGRLVLRGVPAVDGDAIADGLRTELGRQLERSADRFGVGHAVPSLRLSPLGVRATEGPAGMGRVAGRAVAQGILR